MLSEQKPKRSLFWVIRRFLGQCRVAWKKKKPLLPILKDFPVYLRDNLGQTKSHLDVPMPWISAAALAYLDKVVHPEMIAFEYGSGGSTLYWAQRVKKLYSIEHQQQWYAKVHDIMLSLHMQNIAYTLVPKDQEKADGHFKSTHHKLEKGQTFKAYAESILAFDNDYFDFIIIDGRARPACLRAAWPKLKKGGYLLFDNADRAGYREALHAIKTQLIHQSFGPVRLDPKFEETRIYRK